MAKESKAHFNGFYLVGQVVRTGRFGEWHQATIETVGKGIRGAKFIDLHTVTFMDDEAADKVAKLMNKRVSLAGKLADSGDPRLLLVASPSIQAVTKAVKDANMAKIVGESERCELFPPKEGKKQFTSVLMKVNGQLLNAVAFRGLASKLDGLEEGTPLQIQGRMRRREFEMNDGNTGYAVDIIADSGKSKILGKSERIDPFEAMPDWDIPEGTTDETAETAEKTTEEPKKRKRSAV